MSHTINPFREHIIFASNSSDVEVWFHKRSYAYKQVEGYYKGQKETSYVIPIDYLEEVMHSTDFIKDQNHILYLGMERTHGERVAKLWELSDGILTGKNSIDLGVFREITFLPEGIQDWTYDPWTKKYFTCVPIGTKGRLMT